MIAAAKVIIQLHDGREITYTEEDLKALTAVTLIESLQARGVKIGDIKNTVHVISRVDWSSNANQPR